MNVFAKGVIPIPVTFDDITYLAQALTVRAAQTVFSFAHTDVGKYIRETYAFNNELKEFEPDKLSKDKRLELGIILNNSGTTRKVALVIAANDQDLEPKIVLDWFFNEPDFFDECYAAALKQNPGFAPVEEAPNRAATEEEATAKN